MPEEQPGLSRDPRTLYQLVGGQRTFDELAANFYALVRDDAVLRPLYPESLAAAEKHLALFLAQYFGGPPNYSLIRGHPRLRARHLPFVIGQRERDAWVANMLAALDQMAIAESARARMRDYFEDAATFLINASNS